MCLAQTSCSPNESETVNEETDPVLRQVPSADTRNAGLLGKNANP